MIRIPSRPLRSPALILLGLLVTILAPSRAAASRFVGSPPLAAHESAWILIDGDDAAAGTTAIVDAAERFADKTLKLGEGNPQTRSVFRFSPRTHDLASMEQSFGRSGELGKALAEVKPAVVVLVVEGKPLPSGPGYGASALTPAWLAARVQDLGALCPLSLLAMVVEPGAREAKDVLVAAASGRDAPFYLMLDVAEQGRTTAAPLSSVKAALRPDAALTAELRKLFPGPEDEPVGLAGALFLAALSGAAEDADENGYDVLEVASFMIVAHAEATGTMDPTHARYGELVNAALWGRGKSDGATYAPAYPLKRRRYTVGVCPASRAPLPGAPNESDASRRDRTTKVLQELSASFGANVEAEAPHAFRIDVLDPAKLPARSPRSRGDTGACARTTARNGYDVWVDLWHDHDDHYVVEATSIRTQEAIEAARDPLPDRITTRQILVDLGKKLVRPLAIYAPTPESKIAAAAKAADPPTPGSPTPDVPVDAGQADQGAPKAEPASFWEAHRVPLLTGGAALGLGAAAGGLWAAAYNQARGTIAPGPCPGCPEAQRTVHAEVVGTNVLVTGAGITAAAACALFVVEAVRKKPLVPAGKARTGATLDLQF